MNYTQIVYAYIYDIFLFHATISVSTSMGTLLILGSSIFLIYSTHSNKKWKMKFLLFLVKHILSVTISVKQRQTHKISVMRSYNSFIFIQKFQFFHVIWTDFEIKYVKVFFQSAEILSFRDNTSPQLHEEPQHHLSNGFFIFLA